MDYCIALAHVVSTERILTAVGAGVNLCLARGCTCLVRHGTKALDPRNSIREHSPDIGVICTARGLC